MNDDREPGLLALILLPFRLLMVLSDLAATLWLTLILGGIVLFVALMVWHLLAGP